MLITSKYLTICAIIISVIISFTNGAADNCYINDSGFTCCNKELESSLLNSMEGDDLLGNADKIQKSSESALGGRFESVVALDDFAYKAHYKEGKTCKVEKSGKYAMAWQP
ncbi:Ground-like domain-containing protein [Strongyloides ratti]|uniref:Ground-like domain-containing protein n=1 Tax=Strongyloides ratti TaxID=34506 RepID=A0A090LMJ9_STRRB|nr:Ground-like domain-containing protein [Strongyloides ratti]CEF69393.1 Ground-like domain-containing protein [Strongyloides ratti]